VVESEVTPEETSTELTAEDAVAQLMGLGCDQPIVELEAVEAVVPEAESELETESDAEPEVVLIADTDVIPEGSFDDTKEVAAAESAEPVDLKKIAVDALTSKKADEPTTESQAEEQNESATDATTEVAGAVESEPGLSELLEASKAEKKEKEEDWNAAKSAARQGLLDCLAENKLRIDRQAEYYDERNNNAYNGQAWLIVRIAKNQMTPQEAVEFAKRQNWADEIMIAPDIYQAMIRAFTTAKYYLPKTRIIYGKPVDVQVALGRDIEAGKITPEEAVQMAVDAGWTLPLWEAKPDIDTDEEIGKAGADVDDSDHIRAEIRITETNGGINGNRKGAGDKPGRGGKPRTKQRH
jgi:hypothetical protein